MRSPAFEAGMPYLEYVKAKEDRSISYCIKEEAVVDTPIRLSEYLKHREGWDEKSDANDEDGETVEKEERKQPNRPPDCAGHKDHIEIEVNRLFRFEHNSH